MKTITKDGNYLRVDNQEADSKVKSGWKYCSKTDWKTNVRDANKPEDVDSKISDKRVKKSK